MSEGNAWGTPAPGSGQTHALHAPRSFDARELFVESCLGQAAVLPCGRTNLLRHTGQHRTGASGESSEGPERSGGRAQEIGIQPDGTKA